MSKSILLFTLIYEFQYSYIYYIFTATPKSIMFLIYYFVSAKHVWNLISVGMLSRWREKPPWTIKISYTSWFYWEAIAYKRTVYYYHFSFIPINILKVLVPRTSSTIQNFGITFFKIIIFIKITIVKVLKGLYHLICYRF